MKSHVLSITTLAAIAMLACGPANAQLQTQGATVGSPGPGGGPKPTRSSCTSKANDQKLKGSKKKSFVSKCMAGEATE